MELQVATKKGAVWSLKVVIQAISSIYSYLLNMFNLHEIMILLVLILIGITYLEMITGYILF